MGKITRREFLITCAGLALGSAILARRGSILRPNDRAAYAAERSGIRATRFQFAPQDFANGSMESVTLSPEGLALKESRAGYFTSPILQSSIPFLAMGLQWSATIPTGSQLQLLVRTSPDGATWGEWLTVEPTAHLGPKLPPPGRYISELLFLPGEDRHTYIQWRASFFSSPDSSPRLESLRISCIDPGTPDSIGGTGPIETAIGPHAQLPAKAFVPLVQKQGLPTPTPKPGGQPKPTVISRTAWGCPDGQNSPSWPPEYKPLTHIVVHHTATSNNAADWASIVRTIWYYHSIELRWGDIGYNYLVDPKGVIYEGRAGGDDVIGGHVTLFNPGTLGLAFLGTYCDDAEQCTPPGGQPGSTMLSSGEKLMAWTCSRRGLDPLANPPLYGDGCTLSEAPTIMGHRDARACGQNNTICPGNNLENLLSQIRQRVKSQL